MAAGDGRSLGLWGWGSYSRSFELHGGRLRIAPSASSGFAGRGWLARSWRGRCAKGGARPWLGRDPWPALPSLSASDRLTVGHGAGKMSKGWLTGGVHWQRLRRREEGRAGEHRAADAQAQVAAAVGGAGRVGGCGSLGLLAGPARPSSPFLLFFLFLISFPLFKFKFGLEFEFKTEVTCSLEFREFCLIITL